LLIQSVALSEGEFQYDHQNPPSFFSDRTCELQLGYVLEKGNAQALAGPVAGALRSGAAASMPPSRRGAGTALGFMMDDTQRPPKLPWLLRGGAEEELHE
jgi:hypothetical protein